MRTVEKVGEGQLPSSTDADCTVRGALKTAQMGGDAAAKVFKLLTVLWMQYTYFIYIYIKIYIYTCPCLKKAPLWLKLENTS